MIRVNNIDPIEVKELISRAINDIENGVDIEKRIIEGPINFNITVSKTSRIGGDIKLYVAQGGKSMDDSQIATISFSVRPRESEREKNEQSWVVDHNKRNIDKWGDF